MSKSDPEKHKFRAMALMPAIVSYLVGPLLIGLFGGRWLDTYFSTSPLFLLIGLFSGLAAGVYGLIKLLNRFLGGR